MSKNIHYEANKYFLSTSAWENLAEDWRTETVPAGSELIHFQTNQTKRIDFKCKKHDGTILGLLVGLGNRIPFSRDDPGEIISELGRNKYFIVTDEDIELTKRQRTPERLSWQRGKLMKEFFVQGNLNHLTPICDIFGMS